MSILDAMPTLGVNDWWLTAGAIFQNVWNQLEGLPPGYGINDYDIFYFDDTDLSWEAEDAVIRSVASRLDHLSARIEVRNEARVHLWYEAKFGVPARPFTSATDAVDAFASTTCCVAVTKAAESLAVYAPFGLEDVFAMHLRPNPRLAPEGVYLDKVSQYRERWPRVTFDPWPRVSSVPHEGVSQ